MFNNQQLNKNVSKNDSLPPVPVLDHDAGHIAT